MSGNNKDTTAMILAAMDDLGPADARTISEHAGVGYSTTTRKLRDWAANDEIIKIDRGAEPVHYALRPTDQPLPAHLRPTVPHNGTEQLTEPATAGQTPDADEQTTSAPNRDREAGADGRHDGRGGDEAQEPDHVAARPHAITTDADAAQAVGDTEGGEQPQPSVIAAPTDEDSGDTAHAAEDVQTDGAETHDEVSDAGFTAGTDGVTDDDPNLSEDEKQPDNADGGKAGTQPPPPAQPQIGPAVTDDAQDREPAAEPVKAPRRPKDYFHTESLAVLRAQPDQSYTAGEVAKLIVAKEVAAGAPASTKASSGAVSNALHKAAGAGECLVVSEKPVKFQAA